MGNVANGSTRFGGPVIEGIHTMQASGNFYSYVPPVDIGATVRSFVPPVDGATVRPQATLNLVPVRQTLIRHSGGVGVAPQRDVGGRSLVAAAQTGQGAPKLFRTPWACQSQDVPLYRFCRLSQMFCISEDRLHPFPW